jgi:DNA mismatch endonuclease (patch repair protein)
MVDVLSPEQRSFNMSRVRGRNTRPELRVRRGLHGLGLRFRLHPKELPGTPDLVLPRYRTVVFVHGCFWHGHGCHLSKMPATRIEFWRRKIDGNVARDQGSVAALHAAGWRVLVIWECAVRGTRRLDDHELLHSAAGFIRHGKGDLQAIAGGWVRLWT